MKLTCSSGWQRKLTYGPCNLPCLCLAPQQIPRSICLKAYTRVGWPFMANSVLLQSKFISPFAGLNVSLCSFLYLHCHHPEFAFKLISSVNVHTMLEKPEVLQFIIISFVFFLIFSPSPDHTGHTSSSVAYCLTFEQLIPVFNSVLFNSCVAGSTLCSWGRVNCFKS